MISVKECLKIAEKKACGLPLANVYDSGDAFIFHFCGNLEEPEPGSPMILINKETGEDKYITIPPFENMILLENSKRLKLTGKNAVGG